MTTPVPHQTSPPEGGGQSPEDHRHMMRRRWLTAVIIVLLIGVPAGYLAISAEQSRDSGRSNEQEAMATGLTHGWPTKVQRRTFDVPIPKNAVGVWYYQTSNWKVSRLYVRFTTTQAGLDAFLKKAGTSSAALKDGKVTVSPRNAKIVGWKFPETRDWAGTTVNRKKPLPTVDITVDRTFPHGKRVYLVSTDTP
ncbi:hypothetical protein [Streptomyces sp. NBC_00859]|uniref:hypothetical protein n=1 Tax=Streptomyces sp. NBC_00859 TaxID=2903682 RepID=UPI00386B9324|nr:hypothetical protein OG584_05430 [Streptomyces sp. NBC_00859]